MRRRPGQPEAGASVETTPKAAPEAILQIKVWLKEISPMIWRRVLVPASFTLHELHGVIQVAMGWEGIHLFQFCLRAGHYGSWELAASPPDVTLAALGLRKGTRFGYEYDLNTLWQHEIRIEDCLIPRVGGHSYPLCTAGSGACPPEDCGGPGVFMEHRVELQSRDDYHDLAMVAGIISDVVRESELGILDRDATRRRLQQALVRSRARERAWGKPFSRRVVNTLLQQGEHQVLMRQQM
ncbi:MAG: plasmid pRiA4b ORF-3 family protein [Rhodospirillales bacterium]|nr:plasmid pRiA4b ORF-3 family protein [Rhodospirillales bacterium]